jgi:hypothetical protein
MLLAYGLRNNFNQQLMTSIMKYRDPSPEILRIEQLVNNVKSGDIKLPKFQRPFVWDKNDILKLWDSVYKGYPIGSILLWLTYQELASERKIADLEINSRPDEYPTNYLLDGQQRLSTLCGALYWSGKDRDSPWNIAFDCDKEQFIYPLPGDEERINLFPLNRLLDTADFINQCKRFEASPNKERYNQNALKLLNSIKDYKIAAVRIGDMNLNEVAPIFERINSSGRQLTMVDLMRAATWKGGFDLNDAIDAIRSACESKNFENIKDTHILRSISGCTGLGIHKEDIDKLRDRTSDQLKEAAQKSVEAYKLAVDFITTELPLPSIEYLPYGLQLTYIVEFFNICPKPTVHQRQELVKWFWKTSFTSHYGAANTGLITKDLDQIREFAAGRIDKPLVGRKVNFKGFLTDNFILNKASSLTFALLLATKKPRSFLDGTTVDTYRALSQINKLEFHHVFPKAFLQEIGISKSVMNYHYNISMQNLSNNREISDSQPSDYFLEMERRLGDKLYLVLESNFINKECFEAGKRNNYTVFGTERSLSLTEKINSLVDEEVL